MKNSPDKGSLKNLEDQISRVRHDAGLNKSEADGEGANSGFGMAYRVSIEIVVALVVCTGIGWGLDQLFGWTPWAMLAGLVFGAAAGINNAAKTAIRMDASALEELAKRNLDDAKATSDETIEMTDDQAKTSPEGEKRGG
jgi:ATP synthase protein I